MASALGSVAKACAFLRWMFRENWSHKMISASAPSAELAQWSRLPVAAFSNSAPNFAVISASSSGVPFHQKSRALP